MKLAQRLADIEPFRVVEVLSKAKAMAEKGIDVVHMEAGEPDFSSAEPIIRAGQQALADGATYYTGALGIMPLREKISQHYAQQYGVDVPASRILITPGASGGLLLLASLLVDPGEGMLMADPGYPCNRHFLRLVEGEGQLVPVGAEERYQLTAEKAEAAWQANTIGALVASPSNPTGQMLSKKELRDLFELTQQKNGYLLVDELYHGLTYGADAASILQITDQAFVINSFSKYFGMTGWRLGWLVVPEWAVEPLEKLAQNLFISMSTMAQYAALAGFEPETRVILEQRRQIFAQRRDFLVPALRDIGFDIPHMPEGAFYVYANMERFGSDSSLFCKQLLDELAVAVTPGVDFGKFQAQQHVRFAYTTSMEQLEKGVQRMRDYLR